MRGNGWITRDATRDVNGRVHLTVCLDDLSVVTFVVNSDLSTPDQVDQVVAAYLDARRKRQVAVR